MDARMSRFARMLRAYVGFLGLVLASCARAVPSIKEGHALYLANGCASCHGLSGRGDGPSAASLIDPPTNLRNARAFKRGYSEDAIARTIADGILFGGASHPASHLTHHELAMPGFAHLTETERRSIALYVISLRTSQSGPS